MAKGKGGRIHLLDELRGFAIICMVFFHAFFTAWSMFGFEFGKTLFYFFQPAQPYFAALFILISGISCNLSHSNIKRGLILAGISVALTAVTYSGRFIGIYGITIWFGILHLLAFSILFVAIAWRALKKIIPIVGFIINLLLFFVTYFVSRDNGGFINLFFIKIDLPDILYTTDWLCPLGFYSENFFSSDYFPILPWFFMFICGYYLGTYAKKNKFPQFFYNQHIRPLSVVGKYTLWIYIFHQPVIYGLFYALSFIMSHI